MSMKLSENPYDFRLSSLFHHDHVEPMPEPLSQKGLTSWLAQQHGLLARHSEGIVYYPSDQYECIGSNALQVYGLTYAGVQYADRCAKKASKSHMDEPGRAASLHQDRRS